MKGILLISHGQMAPGMVDSLSMFFGKNIPQLDCLSLTPSMGAEEFADLLRGKIEEVDTGEGVVIFADLMGGTPFNQAALQLRDGVDLIAGMNLAMIMEYLGTREFMDFEAADVVEKGRAAVVDGKAILSSSDDDDDYE